MKKLSFRVRDERILVKDKYLESNKPDKVVNLFFTNVDNEG